LANRPLSARPDNPNSRLRMKWRADAVRRAPHQFNLTFLGKPGGRLAGPPPQNPEVRSVPVALACRGKADPSRRTANLKSTAGIRCRPLPSATTPASREPMAERSPTFPKNDSNLRPPAPRKAPRTHPTPPRSKACFPRTDCTAGCSSTFGGGGPWSHGPVGGPPNIEPKAPSRGRVG